MNPGALPNVSGTGPGSTTDTPSAADGGIETALKGLLDRYGSDLLRESGRLKSFLQDECPNAKREISVLLQALDEQVPQDLLRVHSGEPLQSLGPRLAKRLSEQKALAPDASRWAVRTWAQGLGVSAVAMDLGAPSALAVGSDVLPPFSMPTDAPIDHSAANDWIEISRPGHTSPPAPSRIEGSTTSDGDKAGFFARPANRWMAVAVAIVVAALAYLGVARHSLEVTRVDTNEALVADGKKRDVQVNFKPDANVQSVQVRFVRGDGQWDPQPQTFPVSADASAQGRVAANQLALRSPKPATVTFEYTLVAADGKRSAPLERTFDFAAGPADPPVITAINAPRTVAIGKPYTFTINYTTPNGAKIVSVERRVVQSSVQWVDPTLTTELANLPDSKPGSVAYAFQAMNVAAHSTLEFTLIDENGVRSEAKQVAYDTAPVVPRAPPANEVAGCTAAICGRVVNVRELAQQGEGTGIGAVIGGAVGGILGHLIGKGRGNTVATVGGVAGGAVAGHEGEKYLRSTKSYQVTVRLDNGSTRTVTQADRVEVGNRVRLTGNGAVLTN
jgi:outer membrane lipoprotein SlyB